MMAMETIQARNKEQAREAARSKKQPYVFFDENDIKQRPLPLPDIGDYRPKGWTLVDTLFCDHSGFGRVGEPALTIDEFLEVVRKDVVEGGNPFGYAIIETGQFQLYVGRFKKTATAKAASKAKVKKPAKS